MSEEKPVFINLHNPYYGKGEDSKALSKVADNIAKQSKKNEKVFEEWFYEETQKENE